MTLESVCLIKYQQTIDNKISQLIQHSNYWGMNIKLWLFSILSKIEGFACVYAYYYLFIRTF